MMTTFPRCANCGIPIRWEPTLVQGRPYCCTGCAQGGPCSCDYSRLPRRGEEAALVQMSILSTEITRSDRHHQERSG
ncbi:MAG: hypothetical protein D6759_07550 [Chloroflexi bacterium]|nr:MAG: hypothetical protein D6759_07550 [Chloroflexota bacterium]